MKISAFSKIALALIIAISAVFTAEAAKKPVGKRKSTPKVTVIKQGVTHIYADGALVTRDYSMKRGKTSLSVEYPIGGNPELVDAARQWIKIMLLGDQPYSGSIETPDAMMKKTFAELKQSMQASEEIKVEYSNDKIVTYNRYGDIYDGGVHGMQTNDYRTFSVADGQYLTASMLPGMSVMKPFIIKGFTTSGEVTSEEVNEFYSLDSLEMGSPYVKGDGLHIIYGLYDIAPYVAGFPDSIIPFSWVENKVSSSVAKKYF